MSTGLHTLKRTTKRKAAPVGRGGVRGKTSGRGHKGQKAHAGRSPRPDIRDVIKKLPKKRGFGRNRSRTVNSGKKEVVVVSLSRISSAFDSGEIVSPQTLVVKGVIASRGSVYPSVKILANGELNTNVTVSGCAVSESARMAIEKAGGSVKQGA